MNALPYPDFDDFFAEFNATGFKATWQPRLFFETSRGCWWGEKKHCTFCGLNGQTMEFRSKTGARALEELTAIVAKHPGCEIQVVDNILDMRYFNDFLPALAASGVDVELFYETKANLKKDQVRQLRDAGVTSIQPGIESFSDNVLTLMRKGVTALQNIQLLKWVEARFFTPTQVPDW
jgi:ribosomal peptide maturation radical SAM protein 1